MDAGTAGRDRAGEYRVVRDQTAVDAPRQHADPAPVHVILGEAVVRDRAVVERAAGNPDPHAAAVLVAGIRNRAAERAAASLASAGDGDVLEPGVGMIHVDHPLAVGDLLDDGPGAVADERDALLHNQLDGDLVDPRFEPDRRAVDRQGVRRGDFGGGVGHGVVGERLARLVAGLDVHDRRGTHDVGLFRVGRDGGWRLAVVGHGQDDGVEACRRVGEGEARPRSVRARARRGIGDRPGVDQVAGIERPADGGLQGESGAGLRRERVGGETGAQAALVVFIRADVDPGPGRTRGAVIVVGQTVGIAGVDARRRGEQREVAAGGIDELGIGVDAGSVRRARGQAVVEAVRRDIQKSRVRDVPVRKAEEGAAAGDVAVADRVLDPDLRIVGAIGAAQIESRSEGHARRRVVDGDGAVADRRVGRGGLDEDHAARGLVSGEKTVLEGAAGQIDDAADTTDGIGVADETAPVDQTAVHIRGGAVGVIGDRAVVDEDAVPDSAAIGGDRDGPLVGVIVAVDHHAGERETLEGGVGMVELEHVEAEVRSVALRHTGRFLFDDRLRRIGDADDGKSLRDRDFRVNLVGAVRDADRAAGRRLLDGIGEREERLRPAQSVVRIVAFRRQIVDTAEGRREAPRHRKINSNGRIQALGFVNLASPLVEGVALGRRGRDREGVRDMVPPAAVG